MRITLVVTVDLDLERAANDGFDVSDPAQLAANMVLSEFDYEGHTARVDRYLVPKLAEHLSSAQFKEWPGNVEQVAAAAEALVQWTRMGEGE